MFEEPRALGDDERDRQGTRLPGSLRTRSRSPSGHHDPAVRSALLTDGVIAQDVYTRGRTGRPCPRAATAQERNASTGSIRAALRAGMQRRSLTDTSDAASTRTGCAMKAVRIRRPSRSKSSANRTAAQADQPHRMSGRRRVVCSLFQRPAQIAEGRRTGIGPLPSRTAGTPVVFAGLPRLCSAASVCERGTTPCDAADRPNALKYDGPDHGPAPACPHSQTSVYFV